MFIDKDRDGNYECCVFLGFFYKRNYLKIKLLLLLLIYTWQGKPTHHLLNKKSKKMINFFIERKRKKKKIKDQLLQINKIKDFSIVLSFEN